MNELDTILTAAEILFFAVMIILAVYLIISVNKITVSVQQIEKEIKEVSDGLTPVISEASLAIGEISEVLRDVSSITENIKEDYVKARPAVLNIIDKARDIGSSLSKVKEGINSTAKFVSPIYSGVSTALKFLKK